MDSNYSNIAKDSSVELQKSHKPGDEEKNYGNKKNSYAQKDATDEHPLVGHGCAPYYKNNSGSGIAGAVFNLSTTVVGAGIMALPAVLKALGIILGTLMIILMGILSEYTVELLVKFSVLCKASNYGEVVQHALGRPGRVVSEICIIMNTAGMLVVYLIIIGDVMAGSQHHTGVFEQWFGKGFWDQRELLILFVLVIFLTPLCALDKIDSLSLTSAASVVLAIVFVVVACIVAFIKVVEGTYEKPRTTPDVGSREAILGLLVVIPVMTNAYVCHFNVQPIYNELEERSPQMMSLVGRITTLICSVIYIFTAISCYLLFGKDTESDVLTNFDKDLGIPHSTAVDYIVRIGYFLHLVLVFPVIHFSLRQTADALVFEKAPPLSESRGRCLALTLVLLLLIYMGSTMIPNIWTAFKFTGATTAVSLGFIFPSLIALRLGHLGGGLSPSERYLSWFMLIFAIIVGIVGVIGNMLSGQSKSK